MSNTAHAYDDENALATIDDGAGAGAGVVNEARPVPRISIQAWCESRSVVETIQIAAEDRRLTKANVSVHEGGTAAAVAHYEESPTPNLILIESTADRDTVLAEIDALAECCDAGTKVVVVGHVNDVVLYRELIRRGQSTEGARAFAP
ncbi:MAG: CtpF protein, partial [Pseudomonadota bacterium]